MKHKQFILLFALFMIMVTSEVSAYDVQIDGIYYNRITATDVEVTYNDANTKSYYTGDIIIPDSITYNGRAFRVSSIGYRAFYDCTGLTSITIPNSVTEIGWSAFYGCI